MTYKIIMENLLCTSCAGKIEKTVNNLEYVEEANYNLATQTMTLSTNKKMEDDDLLNNVTKIVDSIEDGVIVYFKNQKKEVKKTDYGLYVSILGVIMFLVFAYLDMTAGIYLSYVLTANKIIRKSISSVIHKSMFDENTLMFIATMAAMYIQEYYEAIAVLVFYSVGEFFQERAVHKSRKEISNLVSLKSDKVKVVKGLKEYIKEPEELELGDVMLIPKGKLIPVEGISRGITSLDTAQITGESVPLHVVKGDKVISGSINMGETIEVEVTKLYQDSTLYKVIDLIENSTANKSETEKFITKFAKYYTPIVSIIALMIVVIPTLINVNNFNEYLYRGAIFLVISCPCALVLSIPLSYFAGIGKSASLGVLYKGSNHLETLTKVKNLFTDKTGTLTKGVFEVTDFTSNEVLTLAASIERFSTHPIGNAIVSAFNSEFEKIENVKEEAGKGLTGLYNNEELVVGSKNYMEEFGITVSNNHSVHVALNNEYLGYVEIKDTLKDSSLEAIEGFKQYGIEVYMLTGDQSNVASEIAETLDIHYESGLLPDEKLRLMEEKDGQSIFIGDGINDAPSLANADVGVSMGMGGSDLAIEVADVIVMDDSLLSMFKSYKIALKTRAIVLQNIIFALGIKLVFLGLGGLGMTSMWMAIFADVGVSLLAVLNSLRILRK